MISMRAIKIEGFIVQSIIAISHTIQNRADRVLNVLGKFDLSDTLATILHLLGPALMRRTLNSPIQFKIISGCNGGVVVVLCLTLDTIIMRDHRDVSVFVEKNDHVGVVLGLWLRFDELEVSRQFEF